MTLLLSAACSVFASPAQLDDRFQDEQIQDEQFMLRAAALKGDPLSDLAIARVLGMRADDAQDQARKQALLAAAELLRDNVAGVEQNLDVMAWQLMQEWPPGGDATERAARVQRLELGSIDNAFYAISVLHLPEYRDAPAAAAKLIHRAAQAPRYRSHFVPVGRSLSERFLALARAEGMPRVPTMAGVSPESLAFIMAIGVAVAVPWPAYQPFSHICSKDAFDQLRVDCRRLATLMVTDADTFLDVHMGIAALKRMADSAADLAHIQTLEREQSWLQEQAVELSKDMHPGIDTNWTPEEDARFKRFAQVWFASGEVEAQRHLLREAQISELPPAQWRSAREQSQSAN